MVRIETALLVLGRGPAALVAAKVAGACGQPCLLVGHEITGDAVPIALDTAAAAVLDEHRMVDILRPHLVAVDPLTIAPREFEEVLKQFCVADLNVGVYDGMALVDPVVDGRSVRGVLTDGRSRWELQADTWVDGAALAVSLSAAIVEGASATLDAIAALQA